jgi:3-hydroxyacyl-CoA dehydrogenase
MTLSKAEEVAGGVATVVVVNDDTPGLVVNALAVAIIAKAATQRNFMLLLKIKQGKREL